MQAVDYQRFSFSDCRRWALAKPVMRYLEQLPSSGDPSAPLFPEAYAARQRSRNSGMLSNQFYEILMAAGLVKKRTHGSADKGRTSRRVLSEITFHSLRHTTTSLLKNAGVSDVVSRIQEDPGVYKTDSRQI